MTILILVLIVLHAQTEMLTHKQAPSAESVEESVSDGDANRAIAM